MDGHPNLGGPGHSPTRRIGVVVVDSQHVVRLGLSLLISAQPDLEILADAGSADEAIRAIRRLRRKTRVVVLVGVGLSGEHDGTWLVREIRESFPYYRVLGCGVNGDKTIVSRALFAGADGYVDKCSEPQAFLDALRRADSGEMVLEGVPPDALGPIADALEESVDQGRGAGPGITGREREVLGLAAKGLTSRQVAGRLGIRERTVTTHLEHIYRKLGVSGRVAAISAATRLGLLASATAE